MNGSSSNNNQINIITIYGGVQCGNGFALRSSMSARDKNPKLYPNDTELTILDFPTCETSDYVNRGDAGIHASDIVTRDGQHFMFFLIRGITSSTDRAVSQRVRVLAFQLSHTLLSITNEDTFARQQDDGAATALALFKVMYIISEILCCLQKI